MYRNDAPAWFRDAKWLSAIVLVPVVAAVLLFFSLAELTGAQRSLPILRDLLQLTLLPEGPEQRVVAVRQGVDYVAGEPLRLLPDLEIYADPTEVATFTVGEAQGRIAGVLAERAVFGGQSAAESLVSGGPFAEQLRQAFAGPVPVLLRSHLEAALLPSGLDDGSRLANWRLQASQNPGQSVQPIVGVFVFVEPATLQRLSDREIGELVVARLAETVLDQGLPAAQAQVTNPNLLQRLTLAVEIEARESIHGLFQTLLISYGEQAASRLEQAQAVLAARPQDTDTLAGLVSAEELAGLSADEANQVVLDALAERAYAGGSGALLQLLTDQGQRARFASVQPLVDGFDAGAHQRYIRLTWLLGAATLLLLVLLLVFSRGWGRLANPGLALLLGAGLGALLFTRLSGWLSGLEASLPAGVGVEGPVGVLTGLLSYVGARLSDQPLEVLVRNHLIVLAVGGGLVVLSLLLRLGRVFRPRRRSMM